MEQISFVRPKDLPDFERPPLNKVLVGIQFDTPQGFQQIQAGEVWKLFSNDFPSVQELPTLLPQFETFGPQLNPFGGFVPFSSQPFGLRYWFISDQEDEIIQFQHDRFIHNWKKRTDGKNEYPRFEKIMASFIKETERLQTFFAELRTQLLTVRQCEISYINQIRPETGQRIVLSDWLNFLSIPGPEPEEFMTSFRRVVPDEGSPRGRLICDAVITRDQNGLQVLTLSLSVRGIPVEPSLSSSMNFLQDGRERIVRIFDQLTTDKAHRVWGKK